MTNKEYHERPEISKSDLDLLAISPLHFKEKFENREYRSTESMVFGAAVHTLILEPHLFEEEYAIYPNIDRRTKVGKEAYLEFEAGSIGKTIITGADYERAKIMAENVLKMRETAKFLKDGKAEQSYISELEGVEVKCRPDFYNENLGLIIDIKTIGKDATKSNFENTMANFNYHMQAAFYEDILESLGKKATTFLFIAVESKAPHYVGFYQPDAFSVEKGRERYKKLLEKYKWCVKNNNWHGYASENENGGIDTIQTATLPSWKLYEEI